MIKTMLEVRGQTVRARTKLLWAKSQHVFVASWGKWSQWTRYYEPAFRYYYRTRKRSLCIGGLTLATLVQTNRPARQPYFMYSMLGRRSVYEGATVFRTVRGFLRRIGAPK